MRLVAPARRPPAQPPPVVGINWGHPLAQGLVGAWIFNQGAGVTVPSLVSPRDGFTFADPVHSPRAGAWQTANELGINSGTNATGYDGMVVPTASGLLQPPKNVTIVWRGVVLGANGVANARFASMEYSNADVSPWLSYGMVRDGNDTYAFRWNNGAAGPQVSSITPSPVLSSRYGLPIQLALALNGDAGTATGYDGAQQAFTTATGVGTIAYTSTSMMQLGGIGAANGYSNSLTSMVLVYSRALPNTEIRALYGDPYAWARPPGLQSLVSSIVLSSDGFIVSGP